MNEHYSDYVKKNITPSQVVFEKIKDEDKKLFSSVHLKHIKKNLGMVIILGIGFVFSFWLAIRSVVTRLPNPFFDIFTLVVAFAVAGITFYFLFDVLGPFRGVRKGVLLSSERIQELKDNQNAVYQYVFDIYLEDTDQTLMSYQVDREVFETVIPGDGLVLIKSLRKIKVLADPTRKNVMDVSKIKSGIDRK